MLAELQRSIFIVIANYEFQRERLVILENEGFFDYLDSYRIEIEIKDVTY